MSIRLHFGDVLVRKWHDGTGGLDGNELLQRRPDDIRLHLHVMGFPRIGAHRHQRGYRPGCARLPHNGRQGCDDNGGNANGFNCSLHQNCRAVAGPSPGGEDDGVYILAFEHFSNLGTDFRIEAVVGR